MHPSRSTTYTTSRGRRKLTGMTPSSLRGLALAGVVALLVGGAACAETPEPETPDAQTPEPAQDNSFEAIRTRANAGDAEAQVNFGLMYYGGLGVPQDDVEAYKWFILATTYADASEHDKNYVCSHCSCQEPVNDPARLDA